MTDTPSSSSPARIALGCATVPSFLLLSLVWIVLLSVALAVVLMATVGMEEASAGSVPAWLNLLSFIGILGGMAGIGAIHAKIAGRPLGAAFALRAPPPVPLIVAFFGGFIVGLLPGWLADWLSEVLEDWSLGALDQIALGLTEGPLLDRILMVTMVVVLAPLLEELVFRGFVWDGVETPLRRLMAASGSETGTRWVPALAAWLVSSLLFGMFHIDPVQGTAVLFTGAFLGWLRLVSGSVWPAVVAHLCNNLLATVAAMAYAGQEIEPSLPFWVAGVGALVTFLLGVVAWFGRRSGAP